jgi:putative DNA primase/helicase
MLRVKQNIAARNGSGLRYRIATKDVDIKGEPVPQPYIQWLGETDKSADDLLAPKHPGRPPKDREDAGEWLESFLLDGAKLATEVEQRGMAAGFAYRTLQRAKDEIGAASYREGDRWYWRLRR